MPSTFAAIPAIPAISRATARVGTGVRLRLRMRVVGELMRGRVGLPSRSPDPGRP